MVMTPEEAQLLKEQYRHMNEKVTRVAGEGGESVSAFLGSMVAGEAKEAYKKRNIPGKINLYRPERYKATSPKMLRALGTPIASAFLANDLYQGYKDAPETFNTPDPTWLQNTTSAIANAGDNASFGLWLDDVPTEARRMNKFYGDALRGGTSAERQAKIEAARRSR